MSTFNTKVDGKHWQIGAVRGSTEVVLTVKDLTTGEKATYSMTPALANALGHALQLEALILQAQEQLRMEARATPLHPVNSLQ